MRLAVLVIAAAALAACQSVNGPERSTSAAKPAASVPAPTVVRGRAFFLERIMLPPGITLDVQLIDDDVADASAASATIASATFRDLHGPPYEFALPYDHVRITASGHYSLRAALRDAQGHLEFATDKRVEVKPGAHEAIEFRLVRTP